MSENTCEHFELTINIIQTPPTKFSLFAVASNVAFFALKCGIKDNEVDLNLRARKKELCNDVVVARKLNLFTSH